MKAIKTIPGLFLAFFLPFSLLAQEPVLDKDVAEIYEESNFGPNKKHYHQNMISFSIPLGASETGADLNYFRSLDFSIGHRYKRKLANFYALGLNTSFNFNNFNLKQNDDKLIPTNVEYDKEKIMLYSIEAEHYHRFNFGKRGNNIGTFLDIGIAADWVFFSKHETEEKDLIDEAKKTAIINKKLDYVEPFVFYGKARFGYNHGSFVFSYRLTDIFKGSYDFPEFTPFKLGIELSL